jgi:hypothetical protein
MMLTNTSSLTSSSVQPAELDDLRRSLVVGGSLTRTDTGRLLDACALPCSPSVPPFVRILAETRAVVDERGGRSTSCIGS